MCVECQFPNHDDEDYRSIEHFWIEGVPLTISGTCDGFDAVSNTVKLRNCVLRTTRDEISRQVATLGQKSESEQKQRDFAREKEVVENRAVRVTIDDLTNWSLNLKPLRDKSQQATWESIRDHQVFETSGVVELVRETVLYGGFSVNVKGATGRTLLCYFNKSQEKDLMKLRRGDQVTIKGRKEDTSSISSLRYCVLLPRKEGR